MRTFLICLFSIVSGCATIPEYDVIKPPGYTIQESKQHLYECRMQNRLVLPGSAYTPPRSPVSGGFYGGLAEGLAQSAARPRVVYDNNMVVQCLEAKGYRFVPKSGREPLSNTEWVPRGYRLVSD